MLWSMPTFALVILAFQLEVGSADQLLDGLWQLSNADEFSISGTTMTLTKGWNAGGVYKLSAVTTNSFSISGGYGGGSATYTADTITFMNANVATKQVQHTTTTKERPPSNVFLGYFANWFQWWPQPYKFLPSHIQADKITHINFAFAMVGSKDYVIDGRAAPFEIRHFEDNDVSNWGPPSAGWDQPCAYQVGGCQKGLYEQVNDLKSAFPHLQTLISVGGWGMNTPARDDPKSAERLWRLDAGWNEYVFSDMVGSVANRAKFIASVVRFCRTWNFDGLDLDWEYPGDTGRGGRPSDKADFVSLLKELRSAFDTEAIQSGRPVLLLTAAVGVGPATAAAAYDVPALNQYLDFINLMTYDIYGGWSATTGIHSQLYAGPGDEFPGVDKGETVAMSGSWAVEWWISQGANPHKLNLGLATYSRSFTLSSDEPGQGPGSSALGKGAAQSISEMAGTAAYYEMLTLLASGAESTFDSQRCGAYLQKGNLWMGFDDENTMRCKAQYVKDAGLLGAFVWDLPEDNFLDGSPLISTFSDALFGTSRSMTTSRVSLPPSSTTFSTTAQSSPTQPFCVDKKEQGLIAAPANWPGNIDCRGYFNCWNGDEPMLMCPEGAMFDSAIKNCQWLSLLDWECASQWVSSSTSRFLPKSTATMTSTRTTTTSAMPATTSVTSVGTAIRTTSSFAFLSRTTTTTTASSCNISGVADLVTPEIEEFLSRALVKGGEPQVDVGSPANNQENVQRIMRVLPSNEFEFLFPRANKGSGPGQNGPYSYLNFLKSAWQFPYFCNEPGQTDTNCKEELVAMFAHFAQEVGEQNPNLEIPVWRQGLYHYEELCAPTCIYRDTCDDSSWQATNWPCPTGLSYHGRGAKQLTHNYNYGPFSTAMFGDSAILLNDPDRIIRDGWLAFSSAFWFYMTPQPPKPSMHDVVTGRWQPNSHDVAAGRLPGFGVLIMIINGAQECSNGPHQWATNRINFFKSFSDHFSLPVGAHVGCEEMPPFDNDGAALHNMYWASSAGGGCELQEFVSPCNLLDTPHDLVESYCQCSACGGVPPVVCPPSEPLVSCSKCGNCVANQCHDHGATDAHCAPCANGGQSWWPCDVDGLCTCAD